MTTVRVGIVGAGYIGSVHANILARDPRAQVTMVYDIVPERAATLARAVEAEQAPSLEAVLEQVDAIYITTPNTQHAEITLAALQLGRHVFCEKPMATRLDQAKTMLEASQHSRGVFQVGHNRRFAPVYQKLKELIETDRFTPHSAHVKMNRGELLEPAWVGDPQVTGGFLFETTVHMLDMVRWLFGDVASVDVIGSTHQRYPESDDFSMLLRFSSGLHLTFASSADASWFFPFERIEVFSHHATIETQEMERISFTEGLGAKLTTYSFHPLSKEEKWGYRQEDEAFLNSILDGTPVAVSALDGYKAIELVEACYRAAQAGKRLQLSS